MLHSDAVTGNRLQFDREVAHTDGPNLTRVQELFHLRPCFVHSRVVKRYVSSWQGYLCSDGICLTVMSMVIQQMEVDNLTCVCPGNGTMHKILEYDQQLDLCGDRMTYEVDVIDSKRLQTVLEKFLDPVTVMVPVNEH